jgi:hypothetical protein
MGAIIEGLNVAYDVTETRAVVEEELCSPSR